MKVSRNIAETLETFGTAVLSVADLRLSSFANDCPLSSDPLE